ncbi:MAG: exodeoxyribonuclease VII large subunit [Desulfobacterales bacterium]|nr:exodeoxyribonuclease VII large subunit [Desulfobacterales bacterium]
MSHLTREIKTLLEERFPFIWITGEISNFAVPASGHSYFSLKDSNAVINCAMFKHQRRNLKFQPENGMKIMGMARLSLYEPRGSYQLIFEHMEPEGAGALQVAFEQLKQKLSSQGLFDAARKKKLPQLPRKISIITSGTGAAVRDIIHIAQRRAPYCHLEIIPVKVQGHGAAQEIVNAIELANQHSGSDLIILARGGGSLEDLEAFNSEPLAMAISKSVIPMVTGVGHETDFTIADFVADLRAPTPSGAAEIALPDSTELTRRIGQLKLRLDNAMDRELNHLNQRVDDLQGRLKSPEQFISMQKEQVKNLAYRLSRSTQAKYMAGSDKLDWLKRGLKAQAPQTDADKIKHYLAQLSMHMDHRINVLKERVTHVQNNLDALNPSAILDRGYSMVRALPDQKLISQSGQVEIDDRVEIILSKGRLETRVEKIKNG